MRRSPTRILIAAAATAMVALAACSSSSMSARTTSAPTTGGSTATTGATSGSTPTSTVDMSGVTLKVSITNENAGGMITDQSGAFAGAPYKIEWVNMAGSNDEIEAINAGAVDVVSSVQIPAVVLDQANSTQPWTADDAPFKIIASWEVRNSKGFVLVVHKNSTAKSAADLAGGTLSLAKGAWGQFFWVKARTKAGLAAGAVKEVLMTAADGRTAFRAGQVDALITGYRTGLTLQDEGSGRIIDSSDAYSPYATVALARKGLLDDPAHAAAVADLLQRLATEDQWMNDHTDAVAQLFVKKFSLTPATAAIAARAELRTRVPLDAQSVSLVQEVADTFLALGSAKSKVDVSVLIDDRLDKGVRRT